MEGIDYNEEKNLYTFPLDNMLQIYEQIEPYCQKKRLNLVGVPEFVFKIINAGVFNKKERKKPKVKIAKKKKKAKKKKGKKGKKGEPEEPEEEEPEIEEVPP